MFLKRTIFINWGNIPATEFELGPVNLLSGGNGSGKTTAADAIQTVMTAAHDYLFTYNPGQDETTQRGRGGKQVRTLASYVLGCDDGSYARSGAHGYVAASFYPTQGESATPFTAVICCKAQLDRAGHQPVARQSELMFLILPEAELHLDDFQYQDDQGRHAVPLEKIVSRLSKKYEVERYDTKKGYLKRLYAVLRGKPGEVPEREALNAARAFSRFMAYKPVKSINDFVANEILEKKDLGDAIRTVSDLLKTIHEMESEANQLQQAVKTLSDAQTSGQSYIQHWLALNVWQYIEARLRYLQDQAAYLDARRSKTGLEEELVGNRQQHVALEERQRQLETRLLELKAKRYGYEPLQLKDRLEQQIEQLGRQLHEQAPVLLTQRHQLEASLKAARTIQECLAESLVRQEIPGLANKELAQLTQRMRQHQSAVEIDLSSLLGRDWVDLEPLENHLSIALGVQTDVNHWYRLWHESGGPQEGGSLREQISRLLHRREGLQQKARQQILAKQAEIDSLQSQQVSYPPAVRLALEAIRRQCPQADACVLCDFVEVKEADWQNAIEGYIGGARFSIIVDSEWEAEAIRIVRGMKTRGNARVIQGDKARQDCERVQLPKRSIIHSMEFSHATARYYLTASYGAVEQVRSEEELRHTRRGITVNGVGSGGYSMYRCDISDSDLVFGQDARERALLAKQRELEGLQADFRSAETAFTHLQSLLRSVDSIKPLQYGDRLQAMLVTHRDLRDKEGQLSQLDLSEYTQLEEELTALIEQNADLKKQAEELIKRQGALQTEIGQLDKRCQLLSDAKEASEASQDEKEENLRGLVKVWPEFDPQQQLEEADQKAEDLRADQLALELQHTQGELEACARQFESKILEHNQNSKLADQVAYLPDYGDLHSQRFFVTLCGATRTLESIRSRLKNNILVDKQEKLQGLKVTFNNTFVTHLCHAIYQSINDGKRLLENMNKELEHHRFGADRESFRFDWAWITEFKEYWDFFKEVIELPNLGETSTLFDADLSEKGEKVRDRLMSMLLSEDEQKALRELERISDYRNYRQYEIYKEPEGKQPIPLSQYGTGSGGQLETPAYIIRSAAITSAFRFAEGDSHLRMVLVDEAFSKMDESRSREVINYLTQTLGLQLVFIMPTSKSGPFMDLISNQFVFSKVPTEQPVGELRTRVLVDRQQCNQEKVAELWANHRKMVRNQMSLDFMEEFG